MASSTGRSGSKRLTTTACAGAIELACFVIRAMTQSRLGGVIAHLPKGVTEIYTHPATRSDFDGATPGYCYEEELAALTSPDLRRQIAAVGIERGGFSGVAQRREGSVCDAATKEDGNEI